jgi:hypothetical protein
MIAFTLILIICSAIAIYTAWNLTSTFIGHEDAEQ